ncbi:hypothetical protein L2E82_29497 [Cichorium intybus]|uniref:Uncharacterized protein n=1 Tax=Cichorium intybus TaxID=13427 RepID=A0ACB9CXY9_CICIN|nr:hypothetical protein L2E82_29497 [Cichorium intybus]
MQKRSIKHRLLTSSEVLTTVLGIPAPNAACLAGPCPKFAPRTFPNITSCTSDGSTFALFKALSIAMDPSLVAGSDEREPRNPPSGVRATPTIQTSLGFIESEPFVAVAGAMSICNRISSDLKCCAADSSVYERGIAARDSGAFEWEITPVEVPGPRGRPSTIVDKDEDLSKFDPAKLRKLRPAFKDNGGSVTAGNSSGINDGAAALVLVSGEKALELGLKVIAKVSGYADAEQAPEWFTTSPALAIPKAISRAGLEASQIDFYEINEAFAAVALANQKLLDLDSAKLNVHGGGVSLGHPLGCSGARILVTLLGVLKHKGGKYGAAGVCNGGGGASAFVVELL